MSQDTNDEQSDTRDSEHNIDPALYRRMTASVRAVEGMDASEMMDYARRRRDQIIRG